MSRSDGTFPHYLKLEVDSEQWPSNYFDSSRYCDVCEMRWPSSHLFVSCPRCGEATEIDQSNAPDLRWPEAVKELLIARFNYYYDEYNEGLSDEQLAWEEIKQNDDFDFESLDSEVEKLHSKAA